MRCYYVTRCTVPRYPCDWIINIQLPVLEDSKNARYIRGFWINASNLRVLGHSPRNRRILYGLLCCLIFLCTKIIALIMHIRRALFKPFHWPRHRDLAAQQELHILLETLPAPHHLPRPPSRFASNTETANSLTTPKSLKCDPLTILRLILFYPFLSSSLLCTNKHKWSYHLR